MLKNHTLTIFASALPVLLSVVFSTLQKYEPVRLDSPLCVRRIAASDGCVACDAVGRRGTFFSAPIRHTGVTGITSCSGSRRQCRCRWARETARNAVNPRYVRARVLCTGRYLPHPICRRARRLCYWLLCIDCTHCRV